ncbi:MAG TPA: DUF1700 domain-containing protein [Lachnospiraceae bacterium]|nr:DUF1700 domain-containing protein [Lachnospiraceae bacterium]
MNKAEFMAELERLLQGIPDNERTEALNYYEEYFNDAGVENEQLVIAELESPKTVADNIKDDLRANMDATPGNNNNSAYQSGTSYQGSTVYQGNTFYQNGAVPTKKEEGLPTWAIVLIVIGCVICSPAILGAVGTIFGVLAAIFFGLLGIIIGFGASGLGMIVSGILLIFVGFAKLFVGPFAGLLLVGSGLLILALGILFVMFTIWLCGYALPALCRGIVWLCKKPFEKKGEVK